MTLQELLSRFPNYRSSGGGYQVRCPAHEDQKASLNIKQGDKGILLKCHANCPTPRVVAALGLQMSDLFNEDPAGRHSRPSWRQSSPATEQRPQSVPSTRIVAQPKGDRRIVATYNYRDESGDLLYQVLRYDPKDFRQRRPDGKGDWIWKLDTTRRVLYRLPELLGAHPDSTIWIVEGEKDVDALRALGFIATCSVGGAGKWRSDDYNLHLAGRDVVVIPDNDQPGIDHAHAIELALTGIARSVRVLTLPGIPDKGDVSDWLAIEGNDEDRLVALADDLEYDIDEVVIIPPAVDDLSETGNPPSVWRRTHEGLALELLARANGDIRFVADLTSDLKADTFAAWSGSRWLFKTPAIAMITERQRLMTAQFRAYVQQFLDKVDGDVESLGKAEKATLRFSNEIESSASKKAWREEIKAYGPIHAKIGDFDQDPFVLNCLNGTLDLRSGALRDFCREDYLTRQLDFAFDPAASCPLWLQFLDTVFAGNRELIDYIQRAIGYTLTGDTSEQCLFLCHGPGANGKSVLLEVITALLGEFAQSSPMTTFIAKPNDNGASNDLARMRGARLITASETNEGIRLNEALVKKVTGQDTVTARFLFSEFFDFRPSFKLWIAMNHLPTIRGTDDGIWRRIRLIPFSVIIPEHQRDKNLTQKLKAELPGILAWALAGCLDWQRAGMRTPEAVNAATQGYRSEQDVLGAFISEKCITGNVYSVSSNELYKAYSDWAQESGEYVISKNSFGRRMSDRGHKLEHGRNGGFRLGIALTTDETR